jgi:hypothetical protein
MTLANIHIQTSLHHPQENDMASKAPSEVSNISKHNRTNSEPQEVQHKKQRPDTTDCSDADLELVNELLSVLFKVNRTPKTEDIRVQAEMIQRVMKIKDAPGPYGDGWFAYINDWFTVKNEDIYQDSERRKSGGTSSLLAPVATKSQDSFGTSIFSARKQSTATKTESVASKQTMQSNTKKRFCDDCYEYFKTNFSTWEKHDESETHCPPWEYYCLSCRIVPDTAKVGYPWRCNTAPSKCKKRFETWEAAKEHALDKKAGCGQRRKSHWTQKKDWDKHLGSHIYKTQIGARDCFKCNICASTYDVEADAKVHDCKPRAKWVYEIPLPDECKKCIVPHCASELFETRAERIAHYRAIHIKKPVTSMTEAQRPPDVPFVEALNGLVQREDDPVHAEALEEGNHQPLNPDVAAQLAQVDGVLP